MKLLPILVKAIKEQHGVGLWGSDPRSKETPVGVDYTKGGSPVSKKPEPVVGGGSTDPESSGDATYGDYGGFYITSPFKPSHRPDHNGIDYRAKSGTPIKMVKKGKVTRSGMNEDPGGWGALVQILHDDGSVTRYAHLSKVNVQKGDLVINGTVIGNTGGDISDPGRGNSEDPHLHWEWLPDGIHPKDGKDVASQYFSFSK